MKLSYNWLKEFVDIKVTPDQLANDLNSFGHEVEEVKKVGDDYILDLSITANRGDCLSVLGLAREVAAMYDLKLNKKYPLFIDNNCQHVLSKYHSWPEINSDKVCPTYTIVLMNNIKIKESPKYIIDKLKIHGIKPINNIVDITNYVMIETGQPLHAFDLDKINQVKSEINTKEFKECVNPEIFIEYAKPGETLVTLDGKKRELNADNLIIRDSKKIYDLAGIMGGENSQVDSSTKNIILQSAVFTPSVIRKSSKTAKLVTEASYRYERGVDIDSACLALDRAISIILQCCPDTQVLDFVSTGDDSMPGDLFFDLPIDKINNLLGTKISKDIMISYLKRLGFNYINNKIVVPGHRYYDVKIWQDLAEEVARVYGYDKIKKSLPTKTKSTPNQDYIKKEYIKDILVKNGFTEVFSYSFADEQLMKMLGDNLDNSRVVTNSVAPELKHLRMNLVPSILTAISKNPWAPEIKIFEIGKVFSVNPRLNQHKSASMEKWQLGIAECSKNGQKIQQVLNELNIKSDIIAPDQKVLDYLKIRRPVRYVLVDLDNKLLKFLDLLSVLSVNNNTPRGWAFDSREVDKVKYHPISSFPPTIRDLAFIVDKNVDAEKIRSHVSTLGFQILLVELFDEFTSDKFGKDKKNVAYHIWLQDLDKPMDPNDVDNIIKQIIKSVESKFNGKIRG